MIKESFIVRSSISSQLLKTILFKGFAIAFLGILVLLFAGTIMPPLILQTWGWMLFLISLGLIVIGLLPYRRLSRLQLKPNEIVFKDLNYLIFYSKGRKILTLSMQSIAHISYVHHPKRYGIAIWLKPPPITPIVIHQFPKEVEELRYKGQLAGGADVFFPYFNRRAYDELMSWQQEEQEVENK